MIVALLIALAHHIRIVMPSPLTPGTTRIIPVFEVIAGW